MKQSNTYIMDDPREGQRLLDKVDAPSWIAKYIEPHLQDATAILSVGCGPGVFLPELAAMRPNAQVVGVDLSPERIQDAESRLRGTRNRLQQADAPAVGVDARSDGLHMSNR